MNYYDWFSPLRSSLLRGGYIDDDWAERMLPGENNLEFEAPTD